MGRNTGPVAVVVGGASGIGAAVAALQRASGLEVVVWDIAGEADVPCDVTDPAAVDRAIAATVGEWEVPFQVTVCAGIGHAGALIDLDVEAWDRVMVTNARGSWLAMRASARAMIESGRTGSIVATSSVSGRLADRTMGAYCASKAALDMVVKVAAAEWAEAGIRVNAVAPGVTDTPMLGGAPLDSGWLTRVAARTALGRIGSPTDIAAAIIAVHDLTWVTGQVLECDGGLGLHSPIRPVG